MIATHVSSPIRSARAERSHRVVEAELRDRVDRLGLGDAVVERVRRLVDEGHEDPVRDEPREVVRLGGRLPELARELDDLARRLVGGVAAAHDLDELDHRDGVEEVHADHAIGPLRRRGERRDRDRRGVRREHGLRRERGVGAPEDVLLDVRVLDDRLDHQVGRDDVVDLLDAGEHLVGIAPRPSRRALRGSCASSRARGRSLRAARRAARRAVPTLPPPARSRRPSGRHRRRARARSASGEASRPLYSWWG